MFAFQTTTSLKLFELVTNSANEKSVPFQPIITLAIELPTATAVVFTSAPPAAVPYTFALKEAALTMPVYVGKYDAILAFKPAVVW